MIAWLKALWAAWREPLWYPEDDQEDDQWDDRFPDSMPPPTTKPSDQMKLEALRDTCR